MFRFYYAILIITLLLGIDIPPLVGQSNVDKEYELKSVYIYNFSKYIEKIAPDHDPEFVIGVFGESPMIKALRSLAEKKKVADRPIVIKQWMAFQDIDSCHFLFIARASATELDSILKKAADSQILTISDTENYAQEGVAVNFVTIDDKIRFKLNLDAIDRAHLKVSSKLIKLAILVEE